MISINLSEVNSKIQIATIILEKMELNGITKKEIIDGTHLSKTAVNSVLSLKDNDKDFMFGTLLKVLEFLKIKLFIGKNGETKNNQVLSLF
jgi:predicted XRE-type DNA-binding protein